MQLVRFCVSFSLPPFSPPLHSCARMIWGGGLGGRILFWFCARPSVREEFRRSEWCLSPCSLKSSPVIQFASELIEISTSRDFSEFCLSVSLIIQYRSGPSDMIFFLFFGWRWCLRRNVGPLKKDITKKQLRLQNTLQNLSGRSISKTHSTSLMMIWSL